MTSTGSLTILTPLPAARPPIRAALFDFDGTISTLRQGWEGIMGPLMVEMIAGPTAPTPELQREVVEYIDHSTGVQTIHQMVWLAESVARYGLNPRVLDSWEYKAEYARRLAEPVTTRARRIIDGQANPADFMISGSRAFLDALRAAGVLLYVASGSDHTDVVREVGILGLSGYFIEIAGAPAGKIDCSKEAVLRRLVQDAGLRGAEIVVIGDGRVEIALGREVGAITLGIASDDVRRQGIDPAKYRRLVNAQAHAIIGDFSETNEIMNWLGL